MDTLLLDTEGWDLVVAVNGNIAMASDPYSLAQDAASAIRLFQGELYFNVTKGVPYLTDILGYAPPLPLLKSAFVAAAMTVPGVVAARCFISSISSRVVRGQVQVTDKSGVITAADF